MADSRAAPTQPVGVLRAEPDDLGAIMPIMDAAFDLRFGEAWSSAQMLSLFALPLYHVLLASDGTGAPVGFAAYRLLQDESELMLLAVDPSAGRCGIGTALINAWQTAAAATGCGKLYLEVRANNSARGFYEKLGFSECGVRPGYYRTTEGQTIDAVTMQLRGA